MILERKKAVARAVPRLDPDQTAFGTLGQQLIVSLVGEVGIVSDVEEDELLGLGFHGAYVRAARDVIGARDADLVYAVSTAGERQHEQQREAQAHGSLLSPLGVLST